MMATLNSSHSISFIGVGPQKTGSTWLYETLKDHPEVCLPVLVKEVQFFDLYYQRGLSEYWEYFSHRKGGQVLGEITPGYFDESEVPKRIHEHFPETKIIISLRHPVKRAESLFLHHYRKGRVSRRFSEAIVQMPRIVDSGKYSEHISRWQHFFKPEQIKVILLEDIASSPDQVLREVLEFIGANNNYKPTRLKEKVNKSGVPKYPLIAKYAAKMVLKLKDYNMHKMVKIGKSLGLNKVYSGGKELPSLSEEEKLRMLSVFEKDVLFVEELLERSLPAWKKIY
ncbi:hypothetical protein OKW21_004951 [Catalinimonas alkaloidigena]|uniref:sulfotransferase family protein n=1 Tax=Catalinimonas alkaloidigena TaxID=1075417 RepID=UPI00240516B3|nr:sulfotransferase [Catalinimonas alkaloidigena]MDF9799688.1 hypothetical protein [Catalinimonas alkaloidigena]